MPKISRCLNGQLLFYYYSPVTSYTHPVGGSSQSHHIAFHVSKPGAIWKKKVATVLSKL